MLVTLTNKVNEIKLFKIVLLLAACARLPNRSYVSCSREGSHLAWKVITIRRIQFADFHTLKTFEYSLTLVCAHGSAAAVRAAVFPRARPYHARRSVSRPAKTKFALK